MANTCDDSDSKDENLKSVPPPPTRLEGKGEAGRKDDVTRVRGSVARAEGWLAARKRG